MMYYRANDSAAAIQQGEEINWNKRPNLTCALDFLY